MPQEPDHAVKGEVSEREPGELVLRVETFAIPAQQTGDREAVPQIVQRRRRDSLGNGEAEAGNQMMERLARRAGMHAPLAVEAEQRGVGSGCLAIGPPALHLLCDEPGDARPMRDRRLLPNLPPRTTRSRRSMSTSERR